jgi:hypothetical protein
MLCVPVFIMRVRWLLAQTRSSALRVAVMLVAPNVNA